MRTDLAIGDPDTFYERLCDAHQGLDAQQSAELDLRLILLLANQIGDDHVLLECLAAASKRGDHAKRQ